MKYFFLILVVIASGCKKKGEYGAGYDGSNILEINSSNKRKIDKINSTITAGSTAQDMGYYADGDGNTLTDSGFGFFGLGQNNARIREGARVCISSSYGRGENAVICGKVIRCTSMTGEIQRAIAWAANEMCMQSDCLPKNMNGGAYVGLDPPGTNGQDNCNDNTGRSTLLSLTRYYSDVARYGLGRRANSFGLAGSDDFLLDQSYGKPEGFESDSEVELGRETLFKGKMLSVVYSLGGGMKLAGDADVSATTEVDLFSQNGFGVVYREGGFDTGSPDSSGSSSGGGESSGDSNLHLALPGKAPTAKQLGLVKTRRGNVFMLSGGGGGPGAEGTAKVIVQD